MITPINTWRKNVYIAKRTTSTRDSEGNKVYNYEAPIAFNMNVQPMTADAIIEIFGANKKEMYKGIALTLDYDINELDKVYLKDDTPVGETTNGENASFIVRRVSKQNIATTYYFESIKG